MPFYIQNVTGSSEAAFKLGVQVLHNLRKEVAGQNRAQLCHTFKKELREMRFFLTIQNIFWEKLHFLHGLPGKIKNVVTSSNKICGKV